MSTHTTRRAIVTGVSSGIGNSLARMLVDDGVHVIGFDREPCDVVEVEEMRLDLSDFASVAAVAAGIEPPIDYLANVAGIPGTHRAERVLTTNFVSVRRLTRAILPKMPRGSAIVNVSSISARDGGLSSTALDELVGIDGTDSLAEWLAGHSLDGAKAYAVSKQAVVTWSARLAADLVDAGVRVNCVSPGAVETPILKEFRESMGHRTIDRALRVVGRHAQPSEIASAIRFLLSPEASWISGQNIAVDGGLMATLRCARPSD